MENNNTECSSPDLEKAAVEPVNQGSAIPAPAAVNAVRKNGRNRRASSSKAVNSTAAAAPSCGLVEDIAVVSEKLSGKHISGYAPREEKQEEEASAAEKESVSDNKPENMPEEKEESVAAPSDQKVHEGPSFETAFVKSETVEVSLSEQNAPKSRPRGTDAFKKAEIPYGELKGQDSVMPPCGFIEKVKKFLSGLFGGKDKKSKNRGYKNGKDRKNFHGKGQRNFKNGGKGGFDKKRRDNRRGPKNFNNRKPNGGGNRKPDQGGAQ